LVKLVRYDERIFALPVYDRMRQAIIEAHRVDEVVDIRDKALACEYYAKLAKDPQNERLACDIRIRAERQAGRLLSELQKSKGGRPDNSLPAEKSFFAQAKEDAGISDVQAWKWQQLAAVPDDEFEAVMAGPAKPSTAGILTPCNDLKGSINRMDRRAL
jgi:hypothetical protein